MEETRIFKLNEIEEANISVTLKEVVGSLKEKGYDPIKQIVGYLMSGDPGYISSSQDARKKLVKFERAKVLEVLVSEFIK